MDRFSGFFVCPVKQYGHVLLRVHTCYFFFNDRLWQMTVEYPLFKLCPHVGQVLDFYSATAYLPIWLYLSILAVILSSQSIDTRLESSDLIWDFRIFAIFSGSLCAPPKGSLTISSIRPNSSMCSGVSFRASAACSL